MTKDFYIQALRGLAIVAVVLIHSLPATEATLFVRPLANWAVALFLFLSGVLSPESRFEPQGGVVRKRLSKVLVPYVVWSVLYWFTFSHDSIGSLVKGLLTGSCAAQLYYLIVYAQLVLITPWLYRALRSHRVLVYAVTPTVLFLRELLGVFDLSVPYLGSLFPTWLIYYVLGLEWNRISGRISRKGVGSLLVAYLAALALQYGSGFAWAAHGNFDIATTQLKLASMVSSICALFLFMSVGERFRSSLSSCRPLVRLGDFSFGIYLCHMAVLAVVKKGFLFLGLSAFGWCFAIWLTCVAASAIFVAICQRMLPAKALKVIGFA